MVVVGFSVESEPGLRERKKRQTRQAISDTARRLFVERGFERVSVAEVARAADVSEATVFNYFPTKEDLVYDGLARFESDLLEAIRNRATGESVLAAFGRFVLEPRGMLATPDDDEAAELRAVTRMIAASPALLAREHEIFARNTESLARLLAQETNARGDDPRPLVAASALIGVHRALITYVRSRVAAGDPDRRRLARDLRAYGTRALELLDDGLSEYATAG
jgi:AcrR family transcriptional regulator